MASVHPVCPTVDKGPDIPHVMCVHAGGRILTPHVTAPITKRLWQCGQHHSGSLPLDLVWQCLMEEMVLMLGISCTCPFLGQETPSPEFCWPPTGHSEAIQLQNGDVLTQLPAVGQGRGKWHYLHAGIDPAVNELDFLWWSRLAKTTQVNFAPTPCSNAHCSYLYQHPGSPWQQSGLGGAFACGRGQIHLHCSTHCFFRLFSKSCCLCAIPCMRNHGIQAHSGAAECCSAKHWIHC